MEKAMGTGEKDGALRAGQVYRKSEGNPALPMSIPRRGAYSHGHENATPGPGSEDTPTNHRHGIPPTRSQSISTKPAPDFYNSQCNQEHPPSHGAGTPPPWRDIYATNGGRNNPHSTASQDSFRALFDSGGSPPRGLIPFMWMNREQQAQYDAQAAACSLARPLTDAEVEATLTHRPFQDSWDGVNLAIAPDTTLDQMPDWRFVQDVFSFNFVALNEPIPGIGPILDWNQFHAENDIPMAPRRCRTPDMHCALREQGQAEQQRLGMATDAGALRTPAPPRPMPPPTYVLPLSGAEVAVKVGSGGGGASLEVAAAQSDGMDGLSIRDRRMARQRVGVRKSSRGTKCPEAG